MIKRNKRKVILFFLFPASFLYSVFFVYPALKAFYVSLHKWSGFSPDMAYVGLANFIELFHDEIFWLALGNNLLLLVGGGILIFTIALHFAFFMNRQLKGKNFFRGLFFFPNMVPLSALAVLFAFVYNYRFGMLNNLLRLFGFSNLTQDWLGNRWIAMGSIIFAAVIIYMGFYLVLLLSGLEKIPTTFYDAARVEGASELQIFIKISVPLLWDVLVVALSLWIIGALKFFGFIWALTKGGPGKSTHTIATYLYSIAFGERYAVFRMGYGTSMGVILLILVVLLTWLFRRFSERETSEY